MAFRVEEIRLGEPNRQLVASNMRNGNLVIGVYDTRTPGTMIVAVRNVTDDGEQLTFFRVDVRR